MYTHQKECNSNAILSTFEHLGYGNYPIIFYNEIMFVTKYVRHIVISNNCTDYAITSEASSTREAIIIWHVLDLRKLLSKYSEEENSIFEFEQR